MANLQVLVNQDSPRSHAEGLEIAIKGTKRGEVCVVDFLTELVLEGRAYHVQTGTKTTAITGDAAITDTAAEIAVSNTTGLTQLPLEVMVTIDAAVGDAEEIAGKSVGSCHTRASGTVFTPLPLLSGGPRSGCYADVQTAGGVTVTAELPTTTRRHFQWNVEFVGDDANEEQESCFLWNPRAIPVLVGSACFYVQIAAGTTGPDYFAHYNYAELPTKNVS